MTRRAIALNEIRTDLMAWGRQLDELVAGPAQKLTQDSQQVLADLAYRIAVIGQVKAGKSSFVNALAGYPGLLPSDVNPWTTAVTRLHFNSANAPADVAAVFQFFDHDEWKMIAEGGGRVRELTERLVPGFTPAALSRHLEAMKQRAAQRLGTEFGKLLGTTHTFPTLEDNVLERYVCAGSNRHLDSGQGRYSDITKTADLYFKSSESGFPTVLIDTPGTNDPFLVRDEITRRTLDGADLHIAVLTAQQPLSTADVALFRILRGLHKDRIVVFVNRIDQLATLPGDAEQVAELVRDGLRAEFPDIDVPIVVGSALWANASLLSRKIDLAPILSPAFCAYARHVTGRDPGQMTGDRQPASGELADILMACSGIPRLRDHLAEALLKGHASREIAHISANFCELARVGEMSAQSEIARLERFMDKIPSSPETRADEAAKLQESVGRARQLSAELEQTIIDLDRQSNLLVQTECDALSAALRELIEDFCRRELLRLGEAMARNKSLSTWRCDAAELRRQIEAQYLRRFRETGSRISDPEYDIFQRLRRSVADVLPEVFQSLELTLQPPPIMPPSLSILGKPVVFDLGHPWWLAWWKGSLSREVRLQQLEAMIRHEFSRVVSDLVNAARTRLMQQVAATLQNARVICSTVVDALRAQNEWNAARLQELLLANSGGSHDQAEEGRRSPDELRGWHQKWQTISAGLDEVHERCQRLLGGG
jgi:signal recognition particle receptor subunit beta